MADPGLSARRTEKQFGAFSRTFFSKLTYKVLDYFLSRILADHTGVGRRFTTLAQQRDFSQALETHCHEACVIVEQYAGGGCPRPGGRRAA